MEILSSKPVLGNIGKSMQFVVEYFFFVTLLNIWPLSIPVSRDLDPSKEEKLGPGSENRG